MATGVRPLVRSRSPIAEHDQRIGIPGFNSPSFDQSTSIDGTLEDTRRARLNDLQVASPGTTTGMTGRRTMEDLGRGVTGDHVTPKSVAGAAPPIITRPAIQASPDISVSETTTFSPDLFDNTAAVHDTPPPLYKTLGTRGDVIKAAPYAGTQTDWRTEKSSSANDSQFDEPHSSLAKSAEARPTRLEPTPRAILSTGLREPMPFEVFESADKHEQEPRVVIGRINVEVVQPVAEAKTSAPPRPGPLTAESVSIIGPLSRSIRSNLRLNLKYR
jgi:hypothetical protein